MMKRYRDDVMKMNLGDLPLPAFSAAFLVCFLGPILIDGFNNRRIDFEEKCEGNVLETLQRNL